MQELQDRHKGDCKVSVIVAVMCMGEIADSAHICTSRPLVNDQFWVGHILGPLRVR